MGGTYRQVGDYFIPSITLPDDGEYQIGKYGRMRRSYLKEYRKILYNNYVLEGTLFKHLAEIDQIGNERIENIVSAMAKMRRSYLKEYRKILYNNYVLEGTLFKHLAEIDQIGNERIENIVSAMAKSVPPCNHIFKLPLCSGGILQSCKGFCPQFSCLFG